MKTIAGADDGDQGRQDQAVRRAHPSCRAELAPRSYLSRVSVRLYGQNLIRLPKIAIAQNRADEDRDQARRERSKPYRQAAALRGSSGTARAERCDIACAARMRSTAKDKHRRHQQQQADDGAHLEIELADDLLVDVGRQHIVLAADHLRHAEIGEDQGEDHEGGADHAIAAAGQRHRPEDARMGLARIASAAS